MIPAPRPVKGRAAAWRAFGPRGAALIAACAALDAAAAGILLRPGWGYEALVGSALHVAAALLVVAAPAPSSRRLLGFVAVLAVPCAGAAIAAVVLGTKGRGLARTERRGRRRAAAAKHQTPRLASALSTCDLLAHGDEEEQRRALVSLARRTDPEAMALLRWAAANRDPDVGLSAALTLDEIGAFAERRLERRPPAAETRHVAG